MSDFEGCQNSITEGIPFNPEDPLSDSYLSVHSIGQYDVVVRLTPEGKLLGIVEIRIRKDFRSHLQTISHSGHHDVEEFYK